MKLVQSKTAFKSIQIGLCIFQIHPLSMYLISTHTVWEASLGLKIVPYIGTVTVVKFMLKLIEIHQN